MLNFTLLTAAAAISLAGAPAFAADPATAAVVTGEGAKLAEVASATPETDAKRYCIVDRNTGSRIPHKECHTRKEWIAQYRR